MFPVNPHEPTVRGLPTVKSVTDVLEPLDVVSLYVPAAVSLRLLPSIAAKRPAELWINPGAESDELIAEAKQLELRMVETCSIMRVDFRPLDFS